MVANVHIGRFFLKNYYNFFFLCVCKGESSARRATKNDGLLQSTTSKFVMYNTLFKQMQLINTQETDPFEKRYVSEKERKKKWPTGADRKRVHFCVLLLVWSFAVKRSYSYANGVRPKFWGFYNIFFFLQQLPRNDVSYTARKSRRCTSHNFFKKFLVATAAAP